ncbi:MAG TPA: gamma carbonic anhydrase family protein [Lachnospiraceae bacterium]|nr:gamma carbonic anhydrase family protein [Lachnospiraceae bacterium]
MTTEARKKPKIHKEAVIAKGAVVIGDVTVEKDSSVWYNAVVRGDLQPIVIGEGSNVQDNAVLHVDRTCPLTIGKKVTVGHGAILHGCTIEDEVLVGMGAVVMNKAVVGKGSIIAAGALVTQNTVIPPGSLVMGNPGKIRRQATPQEMRASIQNAENYIQESKEIVSC